MTHPQGMMNFGITELVAFCDMFPTHNPNTGAAWTLGEGVTVKPMFKVEKGHRIGNELLIEYRGKTEYLYFNDTAYLSDLTTRIICLVWKMKHPPVEN